MNPEKIKILLVDDEPDILEIITYSLESAGYEIHTATNGIEAVEKASKIEPHLIVLDVMMPKMDGIEACEIIRNNPKTKNILITFLTARGEDYSQIAGFNAGADEEFNTNLTTNMKKAVEPKTETKQPSPKLSEKSQTLFDELFGEK